MDVPFDNIGVTNLVPYDVLKGYDVDVINLDGFDSDHGNDNETSNYRRRRLAELSREMEGVINASGQWKVRARYDGKVLGTRPTGPNQRMDARPSGSSGPSTRSKKRKNTCTNDDSQACSFSLDAHKKRISTLGSCMWEKINTHKIRWVNSMILVKVFQDQLQRHLELQSTTPNTIVKITVERNNDSSLPTRVFHRIHVCLEALKLGFKACIRELLGLDGDSKNGPFLGQVLVAVRLDSKNIIYPLANALVEAKSNISWVSFQPLKLSASSISVKEFEKCMLEIKKINPKAHEWLNKIPPEHWARSYFTGRAKSDLLLKNICEVFNGKKVRGRDKPMIILLEYIMEYCMKRILNVQSVIDKCTGLLTPNATRIMESIKKKTHLMKVQWNRGNKYQVSGGNNAEASGSAYRQAQQAEPAVSQGGSGGSGVGAVIGLSVAYCTGGACCASSAGFGVGSQISSHTR
ncbi:hypothetical protein Tco_1245958 [Tanacetum coccineum]